MKNLVRLDDPGRLRSQITSVVCQIQRFDFGCNLVVIQKLIIRTPPGLGRNPLCFNMDPIVPERLLIPLKRSCGTTIIL